MLTGADPVAPYGGAAVHDNRVWLAQRIRHDEVREGEDRGRLGDETLSTSWYAPEQRHLVDYTGSDGRNPSRQPRGLPPHANGATILLYDPKRAYSWSSSASSACRYQHHGEPGWLLETPAGLLDGDQPEAAIRREAMEETGYRVREVVRFAPSRRTARRAPAWKSSISSQPPSIRRIVSRQRRRTADTSTRTSRCWRSLSKRRWR